MNPTPEQAPALAAGDIFQSFHGASGVATRAAYYVDTTMIGDFLRLQPGHTASQDKRLMRELIGKWEAYRLDSVAKVAA